MYISVPKLDGKFMRGLSLDSVANYFSLPLERDEQLSPGIYIAKPVRPHYQKFLTALDAEMLTSLLCSPRRARSSLWLKCCSTC